MGSHEVISDAVAALSERVRLLEAEREVRAVLARYGFFADHAMAEEWLDLFTADGTMDLVKYVGDDLTNIDPSKFEARRFVGRAQLRTGMIESASHKSIEGRSQHHMDGPPAVFQSIDNDNVVLYAYAVVYAKTEGVARQVQLQSHSMNRWHFRRVNGVWKIAECVRRQMESPDSGTVFGDWHV